MVEEYDLSSEINKFILLVSLFGFFLVGVIIGHFTFSFCYFDIILISFVCGIFSIEFFNYLPKYNEAKKNE